MNFMRSYLPAIILFSTSIIPFVIIQNNLSYKLFYFFIGSLIGLCLMILSVRENIFHNILFIIILFLGLIACFLIGVFGYILPIPFYLSLITYLGASLGLYLGFTILQLIKSKR